jgi:hypothetical protein
MGTGELMPIVQGGHQKLDLNLTISGNTSDYNIATVAAQNGYNAGSDDTPIFVTVNSGVEVTATMTNPALQTGAINAASPLTITVNGTVTGYTGATGGVMSPGQTGSVGGDAIHFNTNTPATGTYAVNIPSGGTVRSGGGGGGGGGVAGARQFLGDDGKGGTVCVSPGVFGSPGSPGAQGGFGQAGGTGTGGSYGGMACPITNAAGGGGPGGAAGFAVRKGGRTVTVTNQGTVQGQTA